MSEKAFPATGACHQCPKQELWSCGVYKQALDSALDTAQSSATLDPVRAEQPPMGSVWFVYPQFTEQSQENFTHKDSNAHKKRKESAKISRA